MQTIGERLEEARKRKGISIREAAEATKIRGEYLQKFESNQFDIGLSDLYVRGFLRTYANLLKLPAERVVSDYCSLHASSGNDDGKPHTPSREIYGRMDISIASASGSKKSDTDVLPDATESSSEGDGSARPRTFSRIGTSLPAVPFIEGRQLIRIVGIVAGVILLVLIFWGIKSMMSSSSSPKAKQAVTAPSEPSIVLIAIDTVRVKVVQISDGKELFQGTLVRGESRTLPKKGSIYITYSEGKNLAIEVDGTRHYMPTAGYDRARVD
jgi:transcriptional regulator with XRE-family HTH domain